MCPVHDATAAAAPLILTLELEAEAQTRLEAERREWFPRSLNKVPAHISLFHALPGEELPAIEARLRDESAQLPAFSVEINDVMKLGRGVAYRLAAPALDELHGRLSTAWWEWLTPQDRQGYRPHVVIQNKVDPPAARALYDRLSAGFRPWHTHAAALLLWHYRGGPWELASSFPLAK